MSFVATPVQVKLMDTLTDGQSRIVGFGGGIRGTKTWGSLAAIIALCRIFPGSRWAVVRKDLQRLRDTTIPSFEKLAPLAGDFVGPVNQSRFEAVCSNGSRILFRGESLDIDPELLRFHGYEVNGFLAEEADELAERTFSKMIERAGTWIVPNNGEQPPPYILCTFNPNARWPKRKFYLPWRDGTIKPPYAFIPTTAADNPYISDMQREAWTEMPEHEYKRFVEGDWESITGAYYDTLNPDVHLIDAADVPKNLRLWGSYDWGYGHWAVMGGWGTDEDGIDYLLDSVWLRKMQDDDQAVAFSQELPSGCLSLVYAGEDCWGKHAARGASGESTFEVFARHKILLTPADTDKVNGGRAVNRQLSVTTDAKGRKRAKVYIVRTKGNLRVFDQLGEIMPDENDIRKPGKVDADANGIGGDDGADMFRYGIATKIRAAKATDHPSVEQDRSPGYDYKAQKVAQRPSADDEMAKIINRAQPNPSAGRYRVPVRRG